MRITGVDRTKYHHVTLTAVSKAGLSRHYGVDGMHFGKLRKYHSRL